MNLINPRITVQNLEGSDWLFSFEHAFSELESVNFTVRIAKAPKASLVELQHAAIGRAVEHLQRLQSSSAAKGS